MATDRAPFFSNAFVARAGRWGLVAWSLIGILILGVGIFRYVLYPVRVIFPPLLVAVVIVNMLNPLVSLLERRWRIRRLSAAIHLTCATRSTATKEKNAPSR